MQGWTWPFLPLTDQMYMVRSLEVLPFHTSHNRSQHTYTCQYCRCTAATAGTISVCILGTWLSGVPGLNKVMEKFRMLYTISSESPAWHTFHSYLVRSTGIVMVSNSQVICMGRAFFGLMVSCHLQKLSKDMSAWWVIFSLGWKVCTAMQATGW